MDPRLDVLSSVVERMACCLRRAAADLDANQLERLQAVGGEELTGLLIPAAPRHSAAAATPEPSAAVPAGVCTSREARRPRGVGW